MACSDGDVPNCPFDCDGDAIICDDIAIAQPFAMPTSVDKITAY